MKYAPHDYAEALISAVDTWPDKEDRLISDFAAVVRRHGDDKLWPKIISELGGRLAKRQGGHRIRIETARPLGSDHLASLRDLLSRGNYLEESYNQDLVAGVRLTIDESKELDYSLAARVKKMFS